MIATYTTLNIFIAIVVNTMNEVSLKDLQAEEEHIKDFVREENKKLHSQLASLESKIELILQHSASQKVLNQPKKKKEYLEELIGD